MHSEECLIFYGNCTIRFELLCSKISNLVMHLSFKTAYVFFLTKQVCMQALFFFYKKPQKNTAQPAQHKPVQSKPQQQQQQQVETSECDLKILLPDRTTVSLLVSKKNKCPKIYEVGVCVFYFSLFGGKMRMYGLLN